MEKQSVSDSTQRRASGGHLLYGVAVPGGVGDLSPGARMHA
jgi:hypothetical protein